jgi:hypothetical protein
MTDLGVEGMTITQKIEVGVGEGKVVPVLN